MKHLPKHLRPRWRYLAVEVESTPDADLGREAFQRALWYAAGSLLGDPGSADADLSVVRFRRATVDVEEGDESGDRSEVEREPGDGSGIDGEPGGSSGTDDGEADASAPSEETVATAAAVVRVRRGEVERGRAAVACVDAVGGVAVRTRVRGVSGTVRACEEKYLKPPRAATRDRTVAFAGTDRRAWTRGRRVDVALADGYAGATERDYQGSDG